METEEGPSDPSSSYYSQYEYEGWTPKRAARNIRWFATWNLWLTFSSSQRNAVREELKTMIAQYRDQCRWYKRQRKHEAKIISEGGLTIC